MMIDEELRRAIESAAAPVRPAEVRERVSVPRAVPARGVLVGALVVVLAVVVSAALLVERGGNDSDVVVGADVAASPDGSVAVSSSVAPGSEPGATSGDASFTADLPAEFTLKQSFSTPAAGDIAYAQSTKVFEADAKDWIGPGGPFGRRVTVTVTVHPPLPDEEAFGTDLSEGRQVIVEGMTAYVFSRNVALQGDAGMADVPVNSVSYAVTPEISVQIVGDGLTDSEVLALIENVRVGS